MTREQLIDVANKRWMDGVPIKTLPGSYRGLNGKIYESSDKYYRFAGIGSNNSFHYDPLEDTLSNWGRGIGLIYRKGVWAPSNKEEEIISENSYQIY
jgi:hypothetical protein